MFFLTLNDNSNQYLEDPDVVLMMEFQKGNNASFESLMRKYFSRVLNFVYRFVNSREVAEDLTQEVFIKVYHSVKSYQPKSKFQTWVFTIAKNISLNELRKLKREGVSLDETFDDGEGAVLKRQVADSNIGAPDQTMIQKERATAVKEAIHALPDNQRIAVLLRRYENLSYEEIANTMDTTVEAVKSLLSRAKTNLKDMLKDIK